jgi:two-component system sensor histidine kinase LytS
MIYVLKNLISNINIILLIAFFLTKIKSFKNLVIGKQNCLANKLIMTIIFGLIGILATYTGVSVNGAIANSRIIGVLVGGLLGGPLVGFGAGLIAGFHRWIIDVGGFTALVCGASTTVEGLIGGLISKRFKAIPHNWVFAFIIGTLTQLLQMGLILLFAKPFAKAWQLVQILWIPMVLFNPIGIAFFVGFINGIYKEQEKEAAIQTKLALDIADRCLGYLSKGLSSPDIAKAAATILQMSGVAAVAITDRSRILAHVGIGAEHHQRNLPIQTQLTKKVLSTGELAIANNKNEIGCSNCHCKLRSAVIVPLSKQAEIIGTIKIYLTRENAISNVNITLANGLARLFSTQLELAEIEYQKKLCQKAELTALQAQINPHFLFNALNTIVSFCRTKPERARVLLINLSTYFRKTMTQNNTLIRLDEEIQLINAYLELEKARFEDKIKVKIDIPAEVTNCYLPPFILQPLVENAVKHGILPAETGRLVAITARKINNDTTIVIEDNGIGIDPKIIEQLANDQLFKDHIGLSNVNQRLKHLYGDDYGLQIFKKEPGTKIFLRIPNLSKGEIADAEIVDH